MKMYVVYSWKIEIEEVEVVRTTDKSVFISVGSGESREKKSTDWRSYFHSYESALSFLIDREEKLLREYQVRIKSSEERLKTLNAYRKNNKK